MQNKPNIEIFHQAFSPRIEIAAALDGALRPSSIYLTSLKEACLRLKETIDKLAPGEVEDKYRVYYTAITIFVTLAEWIHSIRNAEFDAQRFLNSAKLKVSDIDSTLSFSSDERLRKFLEQVNNVNTPNEVITLKNDLQQWSLPLLLFANLRYGESREITLPVSNGNLEKSDRLESTIAFLKFDIDGEPAKQWNYLKPGMAYDLSIEVRVSNWPESAHVLLLTPITIDARERGWLPDFRFVKPDGDGPFSLIGTGRVILEVANSFGSRPYEFLYAAEFDDSSTCRNVTVIGHRRLLIEGSDVSLRPLTGFTNVDKHLLKVRDKLRRFPGVHSDDIANTMTVLSGLGNVAAQALKASLFSAGTLEHQFQNKISEMLRGRADIGEYLQGHPEAAGGITDLTFRDIPLELKVENTKVLFPKDFFKYFDQTAAYTIGLGKRIGILSVLESSAKLAPVGVIEDDIEVFEYATGQTLIAIVVVVIRGGFPKPSSYSR